MKRVLVLAAAGLAAIAVALPATAAAAKFQGVVLTKKPARHAVVTASRNGVVRTTRVRGSLARFRAGRIVAVQAAELPDGTYAASKIKLLGKTRLTRFRGSVVAASSKSLVVSAGMSVLSLVFRGSASALHPGDAVVLGASVSGAVLKTSPEPRAQGRPRRHPRARGDLPRDRRRRDDRARGRAPRPRLRACAERPRRAGLPGGRRDRPDRPRRGRRQLHADQGRRRERRRRRRRRPHRRRPLLGRGRAHRSSRMPRSAWRSTARPRGWRAARCRTAST